MDGCRLRSTPEPKFFSRINYVRLTHCYETHTGIAHRRACKQASCIRHRHGSTEPIISAGSKLKTDAQ